MFDLIDRYYGTADDFPEVQEAHDAEGAGGEDAGQEPAAKRSRTLSDHSDEHRSASDVADALIQPRGDRAISAGEREEFLQQIRDGQWVVARQHHGRGIGYFSMADTNPKTKRKNDNPHMIEIRLVNAQHFFAANANVNGSEKLDVKHMLRVHIHFKGNRCPDCDIRRCSVCIPPCKYPMRTCKKTGEELLQPWVPCRGKQAAAVEDDNPYGLLAMDVDNDQDDVYCTVTSVNVVGMKTEVRAEGHDQDSRWDGKYGPVWNSGNLLVSEWKWKEPKQQAPDTSSYPLLCELLNFCLNSPSAMMSRGNDSSSGGQSDLLVLDISKGVSVTLPQDYCMLQCGDSMIKARVLSPPMHKPTGLFGMMELRVEGPIKKGKPIGAAPSSDEYDPENPHGWMHGVAIDSGKAYSGKAFGLALEDRHESCLCEVKVIVRLSEPAAQCVKMIAPAYKPSTSNKCSKRSRPEQLETLAWCIGINKYESSGIRDLKNCEPDAKAIAAKFCIEERHSKGILVPVAGDKGSWNGLRRAFQLELPKMIKKHSESLRTVVIYFAGHAMQVNNEIYLVPSKANIDNEMFEDTVQNACLALSEIAATVTNSIDEAMHNLAAQPDGLAYHNRVRCIFILDACRSERFDKQASEPNAAVTETFLKSHEKKASFCDRLFMFSTWQGDKASDGSAAAGHSPYTRVLLDNLFVPGKTLMDVHTALNQELTRINQSPTAFPPDLLRSPLFEEQPGAEATPFKRQKTLTTLKYHIYFAVQPVPNVVQPLCKGQDTTPLNSLSHQACKLRLHKWFTKDAGFTDKYTICLSDGFEDTLLDHLHDGARCLVWCALGVNLLHQPPPFVVRSPINTKRKIAISVA